MIIDDPYAVLGVSRDASDAGVLPSSTTRM